MTFWCEPRQDIIIAEQEVEEVSAGGIVLVADESKKLRYAKVLAVGPGKWDNGHFIKTVTQVGDRIAFGKYQSGGEPFQREGKEYILLREGDIIGKMNEAHTNALRSVA